MDYLSHNIAINLKRIRKAKGMSLDVVAEQTGVSKSMLSTIEKGDANPSVGVLGKIISGLRIELQDLTQPPQADSYLVDISKLSPTKDVEGQYHVWTCFPIADNRTVELFRLIRKPERLSVALGVRHRKVRFFIFIEVPALYLRDYCHGHAVKRCYTRHDCRVVTIVTVAVKLGEMVEYRGDIIVYRRTVFLSNYFKPLCCGQI